MFAVALVTLALGLSLCSAASAASTWKRVSPGVTFHALDDITFVDAMHGWAVGLYSAIRTTDGGAHWTTFTLPDTITFTEAMSFADTMHGWVVGSGSVATKSDATASIVATSDGGVTWETQLPGQTTGGLMDVDFIDALHGWAVGPKGLILATSDGGKTWVKQASGVTQAIRGVDFVDAQNGWAVYYKIYPSRTYVLRTSDGGATWKQGASVCRAMVFDVFRLNAKVGWLACDAPTKTILRTTDGGGHWKSYPLPSATRSIDSLAFRDARHGFGAIGTTVGKAIYSTNNGGASWTPVWSMPKRTSIGGIVALAVVDATHAWAAGERNFSEGLLLRYGPAGAAISGAPSATAWNRR